MKFDHLDVLGSTGDKLGDVAGFIFDTASGLLYYIVVDSGGWFKSRRYLLPVGHAQLDQGSGALKIDIDRETLRRYPSFEEERFRTLSNDDLRTFERETVSACCPDDGLGENPLVWGYDRWNHYRQPEWWRSVKTTEQQGVPAGTAETHQTNGGDL